MSAVYQGPQEPVLLRDAYGEVAIYLLPYLKPALVRHSAPDAEIATYQDAVSSALHHWTLPPSRRNVLVAHQFVKGSIAVYIVLVIGCSLLLVMTTLFSIQVLTCLQILTPINLTGKVLSCVLCICMCTNPLGQFMYGIVFEHTGSSTYVPFYAAGLVMLVICFFTRRIFYGIDQLMEEHTM